jgi:hypothetical protein
MPSKKQRNNRKILTAALLFVLLFSASAEAFLVKVARANFSYSEIEFSAPPTIKLQSPLNGTLFALDNVLLTLTITKPDVGRSSGWMNASSTYAGSTSLRNRVIDVSVELDGQPDYYVMEVSSLLSSPFNSSLNLDNLEDGEHSVQVHVSCEGVILGASATSGGIEITWERSIRYSASSKTVYFTVDTTAPTVSILSVENKTYETTDFLLEVAVGEPGLDLMYCLDGQENVTLAGNTTLVNLGYGKHDLTAYAQDTAGNFGASEAVAFTVAEPFPTNWLIAVVAVIVSAAVIAGLLLYFKKRKR